ncbi:von Willebrand factor type A domain-containing protein [Planctomycetota bacterium]
MSEIMDGDTIGPHAECEERRLLYAADLLLPEERATFERHLEQCEACRGRLVDDRALDRELARVLRAGAPPECVEERMVAAFATAVAAAGDPRSTGDQGAEGLAADRLVPAGGGERRASALRRLGFVSWASRLRLYASAAALLVAVGIFFVARYHEPFRHRVVGALHLVSTTVPQSTAVSTLATSSSAPTRVKCKVPAFGGYRWHATASPGGDDGAGGYTFELPPGADGFHWRVDQGPADSDTAARKFYVDRDGVIRVVPEQSGDVKDDESSRDPIYENDFLPVIDYPLSTFAVDVDTASYSLVRRYLTEGRLPPWAAVRIEELMNYFSYHYPQPSDGDPFSVSTEATGCPWAPAHRLVRIGIKGREVASDQRPPSNLVFLIDVSGSMAPEDRLPLLKRGLSMLIDQLNPSDQVALVVFSDDCRLVLPPTSGRDREVIRAAIDGLVAGGSTNGGAGLEFAYRVAQQNLLQDGTNRVILASDGDFNVGTTGHEELVRFMKEKARRGVFLTILGLGMGNMRDGTLEQIADKGNGSYAYLDTIHEARKVLLEQLSGTLITIAKDVKIQVELNGEAVESYRLLGYENRLMPAEDFQDDRKDAGEIGAGHSVTALYELVPRVVGVGEDASLDGRGREAAVGRSGGTVSGHLLTVKVRYKEPKGDTSRELTFSAHDSGAEFADASHDTRFAAAVAAFGMILRGSQHGGTATLSDVETIAHDGLGADRWGYRTEFLDLVRRAAELQGQ